MSVRWYVRVETPAGDTREALFYHYPPDKNPLEDVPERFENHLDDIPEKYIPDNRPFNDVREEVDALDEDTEYWIFDAHDKLGDVFPSVPDIPGIPNPTLFVGVPKNAVIDVFPKENTGDPPEPIELR